MRLHLQNILAYFENLRILKPIFPIRNRIKTENTSNMLCPNMNLWPFRFIVIWTLTWNITALHYITILGKNSISSLKTFKSTGQVNTF